MSSYYGRGGNTRNTKAWKWISFILFIIAALIAYPVVFGILKSIGDAMIASFVI